MSNNMQESQIILAINAINSTKKLSVRKAANTYHVPESSLRHRMKGRAPRTDYRQRNHNLTEIEEEVIVQYIFDKDERGFAPRIDDVGDMADLILKSRGARPVGKLWAYRFVQRRPELKTRFNRVYDFQRALCEDPGLISNWFRLVQNMRVKYGIQDCDFYNFDETGFMMGVICASMVVTRADRSGRRKAIQPGNREWATAIICVNAEGWNLPPFVLVKGVNHLANWYSETDLPLDWVIKPTSNGWTDNETGLEWLKHFDKHTYGHTKGGYRMLVLDGHDSHISAEFDEYCKAHNIVPIGLPAHSSHLTQPLDVGCFNALKRAYSIEIEKFVKAHITHITKVDFFLAFKAAYANAITSKNARAGFRGAGLVPFDPECVISKLDVRIRTPSPTLPLLEDALPWTSQTPHNPTDALSQITLVRDKMANHQGSSPTPLFRTVDALANGMERIAHQLTLQTAELRELRTANKLLSKRRKANKSIVQSKGPLIVDDAINAIAQKEVEEQIRRDMSSRARGENGGLLTLRRCSKCGKTDHNARTCLENI
jgi:hypothetical protein